MSLCAKCGTPQYRYNGKYYCPNCDEKPFLDEEEKENTSLSYVK